MARLRMRGEEVQVQLLDLQEDVRAGRVPGIAEVHHPPWTGEGWDRVEDIPALQEALDAPGARLSAQLRTGPWPWLGSLVTVSILVFGVLQGIATVFTPMLGEAGMALREFFHAGLTGLDPLVFEGRWGTAFRSQLTHGGARHLFPNLAVIGYAGFRVERALGAGGYGVVALASVVVGTVAIALLESVPVMGSSVLGYGLWASMLVVGLRFDDRLPSSDRRFYGFGAIVLLLVLVAGTLGQEGVSHTGHAFGFLGGALATFVVRPESLVPRSRRGHQARLNVVWMLVLGVMPAVASASLYRVPRLLLGPPRTVQVDGWTLSIPGEMADRTSSIGGARAWTTSVNSREGVFASVGSTGGRTPETFEVLWSRRSDGPLELLPPPEPLGEGWTAWRARLTRDDGRPLAEVVEHRRLEGYTFWRLGMLVQVGPHGSLGRRAPTFQGIVASAEPGETDAVRKAREAYEARSGPRTGLAWAEQLQELGRFAQADALYAEVAQTPRVAPDAVKARLALWQAHPEVVPPDAVAQLAAALEGRSGDWRLMSDAVRWLLARGACDQAGHSNRALGELWGDSRAWQKLDGEVAAACP